MKNKQLNQRQSSLLNSNIRGAAFVPLPEDNRERFKYHRVYSISRYIRKNMLWLKRKVNSFLQSIELKLSFFDWKTARVSSIVWLSEAAIEGLLLNFATNQIFGLKFTVGTVLAYGILVKQTIDISRRLMNGTTKHITKKNK